MGEFLSTPNKEKLSDDGENEFVNNILNNNIYIIQIWFK